MYSDFLALASFVLITTFTPGPNNVSCASMGILYGYKKTLKYMAGIGAGFFLVMIFCGLISSTLIRVFPAFENILRFVGAAYILWLAYHTLRANYGFREEGRAALGFVNGFFLQLLNVKVVVYGFTLYSTFLSGIVKNTFYLALSALVFTGASFCSITSWTLFGAAIRSHLNRPRIKRALNLALSLLLVYTAVELSGVLDLLFT